MLLIWFSLLLTKTSAIEGIANEIGNFCLPSDLVHWDREPLYKQVRTCLQTNYLKGINSTSIYQYTDAYIEAWESLKNTSVADDHLYYAKRDLMAEIRDMQLKTTHHAHAIAKCADISKRMPVNIMSSITKEGKYAEFAADVWQHHIHQDLDYCKKLLLIDVKEHNEHMIHHVHSTYIDYIHTMEQLKLIEYDHLKKKDIMQETRNHIIRQLT